MNPTPEACALATDIIAHWQNFCLGAKPTRLAIAKLIDEKLQLPQRNAALAAAQALSDWNQEGIPDDLETGVGLFCQLRDALAATRKRNDRTEKGR